MKKAKVLFLAMSVLMLLVLICGCGNNAKPKDNSGETVHVAAETEKIVYNPGFHRDYVRFVTLTDEPMIKVFSSYNELETFINEGGLLHHVSTTNTHSMESLLNFFGTESFEENVVVLLIPKTGDMRYKGSVTQITGDKNKLKAVIEYDTDNIYKATEEQYALSIALKIPKEYCDGDTQFVFVFGERETQQIAETEGECVIPEMKTEEIEVGGTNAPDVTKIPLGEKIASLADIDKLDAPAWKIEAAKAFLGKDLKKLDELCGYGEAVYQQLSDVEISGFEVWCQEREGSVENDLFMNVTISSVGYEYGTPLREGRYTLTVSSPVGGICIENADKSADRFLPETETEKFISAWLGHMGYKFDRHYYTGLVQEYVEFVHSYYTSVHGQGGTKETYEKYYKTLFGVDVSDMLENYLTFENGGKAEIRYGHGGSGFYHDIVESGEDWVTVQYYADRGRLVYGPRIKYTFTEADGILIPLCYTYEYGENIKPCGFTV